MRKIIALPRISPRTNVNVAKAVRATTLADPTSDPLGKLVVLPHSNFGTGISLTMPSMIDIGFVPLSQLSAVRMIL